MSRVYNPYTEFVDRAIGEIATGGERPGPDNVAKRLWEDYPALIQAFDTWAGINSLLALALWRGLRKYGPAYRGPEGWRHVDISDEDVPAFELEKVVEACQARARNYEVKARAMENRLLVARLRESGIPIPEPEPEGVSAH